MSPETPDDLLDHALEKRGRRQRRFLLIGVLWAMSWVTLVGHDILHYTEWMSSWPFSLTMASVVSPGLLVLLVPLAMIGRYVGNFGAMKPYRYHLAVGLPLIICLGMLAHVALGRIQPHKRFETLSGARFPSDARVLDYRSSQHGLDSREIVEFAAPKTALVELLKEMACVDEGFRGGNSFSPKDSFNLPEREDQIGVMMSLEIDWSTSTAVFEYVNY